jgi:hypothetical protein
MKLMELANNKEIILVSGNLCSGKGHYCSTAYPEYSQIGVSSIVRALAKMNTRSELSTTKDFDTRIAQRLIQFIEKDSYNKIIVDGIRQLSIMQALQNHFGDQIKDIIWLDVPDDVAKERFANRAAAKDDQTYDDARAGDRNLGIEDVESYIRANHKVVPNS